MMRGRFPSVGRANRAHRFEGLYAVAGAVLLVGLLALPSAARAQADACNGIISIVSVSGPAFAISGDEFRMRVRLGTEEIDGGTQLTIDRFRYELSCLNTAAIGCAEDDDTIR